MPVHVISLETMYIRNIFFQTLVLHLLFFSGCSGPIVKLKSFPRPDNVDVLIYEATPSGIIAAVTLKRMGKNPLIIEPTNRVGGIITGGLGFTDACDRNTIGGYTREYFERVGARYGKAVSWYLEPKVGEEVFIEMINESEIPIIFNTDIKSLKKESNKIVSATLSNGKIIPSLIFIDASYEGDLLPKANIPYRTGREAKNEFNEPRAGITPQTRRNQFNDKISPYDDNGKLLPGISQEKWGKLVKLINQQWLIIIGLA